NYIFLHFFFQAEDGIRDFHVTGVQTCALPIYASIWKIFSALAVDDYDLHALTPLVSPVRLGKWREHADDSWFHAIEAHVDDVFECYAGSLFQDQLALRGENHRQVTSAGPAYFRSNAG